MLISRQRQKSTPDMVYDVFNYVTDKTHAEAFGEPVITQSPQARKPPDRMRVHTGDGQTYLVRVDSMS